MNSLVDHNKLARQITKELRKQHPDHEVTNCQYGGGRAVEICLLSFTTIAYCKEAGVPASSAPLRITIPKAREPDRYSMPEEYRIKVSAGYGVGFKAASYKVSPDLSFNKKLYSRVADYLPEVQEIARVVADQRVATKRSQGEVTAELKKFARKDKHSYGDQYKYRNRSLEVTASLSMVRVRVDYQVEHEVKPSQLKAYCDVACDYLDACDQLDAQNDDA